MTNYKNCIQELGFPHNKTRGSPTLPPKEHKAETVYTYGSYMVVGSSLQRVCGTALRPASAFILVFANGYEGSYKALRLDLMGRMDSAATAEVVGAAGTGHGDQVIINLSSR